VLIPQLITSISPSIETLLGTILAITTWTKIDQKTQINTFVRLENEFEEGSGAHYD